MKEAESYFRNEESKLWPSDMPRIGTLDTEFDPEKLVHPLRATLIRHKIQSAASRYSAFDKLGEGG